MVFSFEDKAVIKNDFEEKHWTAYKIVKENIGLGFRKEGRATKYWKKTLDSDPKKEAILGSGGELSTPFYLHLGGGLGKIFICEITKYNNTQYVAMTGM